MAKRRVKPPPNNQAATEKPESIRIDPALWARAGRAAKSKGMYKKAYIAQAIQEKVERDGF